MIDYNNDGSQDVLIVGWGVTTSLFSQNDRLRFDESTGYAGITPPSGGNGGIWSDIDSDGDLDLFLTDEHMRNILYLQTKQGRFTDVSDAFQLESIATSQGAAFGDLDRDGYPDLYVCNWFAEDELYRNINGKYFERIQLPLAHLSEEITSNGVSFGDVDNDADLDILVTDRDGSSKLYMNEIDPADSVWIFRDGTAAIGLLNTYPSYSGLIADLNNDGFQDILFTNIGPNQLFLNKSGTRFDLAFQENVVVSNGGPMRNYSTGAAVADLENDGDIDIFIANKDTSSLLLINPLKNGHFIRFKLAGIQSNRDAIGTKLWLYAQGDNDGESRELLGYRELSGGGGYLSISESIVHFGLSAPLTCTATIVFPSGREIVMEQLQSDSLYFVQETTGIIGAILLGKLYVKNLAGKEGFIWNFLLTALLIGMMGIFVSFAIKRYGWVGSQTVIFIIVMMILFYSMAELTRGRSTFDQLTNQIILLVVVILSVFGFSEKIRQVNLKRYEYRQSLHRFSKQIIFIHDNPDLFEQLVSMIYGTMRLEFCGFLEYSDVHHGKLYQSGSKNIKVADITPLTEDQVRACLTLTVLNDAKIRQDFQSFSTLGVDLIIPVATKNKLFGLLCLGALTSASRDYRPDDVTLLMTLANQAALAIENNNFIDETKRLTEEITEAKIREHYIQELESKNNDLERLFSELKETQSQLIQSEKMSSLGLLVAGIAHELNNPISFIYANMKELKKYQALLSADDVDSRKHSGDGKNLENIRKDIDKLIEESVEGSNRVRDIVISLRNFSRLDEAEFKKADLHDGLKATIMLVEKKMGDRIKLHLDLGDIPEIDCMPGQLNQVFLNLLMNSIQAIPGKGNIWIKTRRDADLILISIRDDGEGIVPENLDKLFEPFFTTKPVGQGTGLGLSISFGIIKQHGGNIAATSSTEHGTEFTVSLPIDNPNPQSITSSGSKA
jgi:signal transduction histidine kinase